MADVIDIKKHRPRTSNTNAFKHMVGVSYRFAHTSGGIVVLTARFCLNTASPSKILVYFNDPSAIFREQWVDHSEEGELYLVIASDPTLTNAFFMYDHETNAFFCDLTNEVKPAHPNFEHLIKEWRVEPVHPHQYFLP